MNAEPLTFRLFLHLAILLRSNFLYLSDKGDATSNISCINNIYMAHMWHYQTTSLCMLIYGTHVTLSNNIALYVTSFTLQYWVFRCWTCFTWAVENPVPLPVNDWSNAHSNPAFDSVQLSMVWVRMTHTGSTNFWIGHRAGQATCCWQSLPELAARPSHKIIH